MSTVDPQGLGSPQGGELTETELASCVRAAVSAPSIHNSQPWRFRYRHGGVDVIADQTRRLEVIDPSGRELLISVGAAIFNLRLAMRRLGRVPAVRLFPDPAEPDLVAVVTPGPAAPPSAELTSLVDAMARRHTNRQPFARVAIPSAVLDELTEAARSEGAELRLANAGRELRTRLTGVASGPLQWYLTGHDRASATEETPRTAPHVRTRTVHRLHRRKAGERRRVSFTRPVYASGDLGKRASARRWAT